MHSNRRSMWLETLKKNARIDSELVTQDESTPRENVMDDISINIETSSTEIIPEFMIEKNAINTKNEIKHTSSVNQGRYSKKL